MGRLLILIPTFIFLINWVGAQNVNPEIIKARTLYSQAKKMIDCEQLNKSDSILKSLVRASHYFTNHDDVKGILDCMDLKMHVFAIKRSEAQVKSLYDSICSIGEKYFGDENIYKAKAQQNLSLLYSKTDKFELALEENMKALTYFMKYRKNDFNEIALIYSNIGNNYSSLEDLKKALEYHALSLDTYKKYSQNEDDFVSKVYFNIGNDYDERSEYDKALEYYFKSVEIKRAIYGEKSLNVAYVYDIIGNVFDSKNSYKEALDYCFKSLYIIKEILGERDLEVAASYNTLAIIYNHLDKLDEGQEYYFKCLKIRKEILGERHSLVASTYNNIATTFYSKSEYDSSLAYFYKSLDIQKINFGEKHTLVAMLYNNIGNVYIEKAEYDKALNFHFKSLGIRRSILGEMHVRIAYAYNSIGNIYNLKGELDKAMEYYFKALEIRLKLLGDKHNDVASSYSSVGSIYLYKEQYEKALEYFFKSLEIRKALFGEKHSLIANLYSNLSDVYTKLYDFDKALLYQKRCIEIRSDVLGKNHSSVAVSYNKLGVIYEAQGDYKLAIEYYIKGISILRENFGRKHVQIAISYNNLGNAYEKINDNQNALICYQKALAANARFFIDTVSFVSNPFARDYLDSYCFMESLSRKAQIFEVISKSDFSKAFPKLNYLKLAIENYQICDSLIDQTRKTATLASDRIALGEKASFIYEKAISACNSFVGEDADKSILDEKAFYFSEKSKGITLLQSLAEADGMNYSSIPDSLIQRERSLKENIALIEKQLSESDDSLVEIKIRGALFRLNRQYDDLVSFLEKEYPNYFNLKYANKQPRIKEIQVFLDKKTAICSYILGDSSLFLFLITHNSIEHQEVKSINGLVDSIMTFRSSLTAESKFAGQYFTSGAYLYGKLFTKSLIHNKVIENLVIIPDRSLAFLPFESLPTGSITFDKELKNQAIDSLRGFKNVAKTFLQQNFKNVQFLINRFNISYAYSATLYYQNRLSESKKSRMKPNFLAIAPVFSDKERNRVTDGTKELQKRLLSYKPDSLSTRGMLLDGEYVTPLPGSEFEVNAIQKEFISKGLNARVLLKRDAAENVVKSGLIGDYRILHFATHGFVNSEKPELSGIILAQDSTGGQDGILYSGELYNLKLDADLTVLSACETGLGKVRKGEGIIGLTRALLFAGSKNIIVSLWPVSDQSTSDLMIDFYKNLLNGKKSQSYSQCLRQAKLKMIKEGKYSHPFYWSPFILVGK